MGVYNFVITLKIKGYTQDDKIHLYDALSEALLYLKYAKIENPRVELDLSMAVEYLFNEIQSTESGLRNPVSK